jgi:NDP-sugar pyrophosphorylase family protein
MLEKKMNLAIIGAGESSRIKAEGLNIPKHLIKIKGEYLIERIIRIACRNNIDSVFCIINENEPELKEYLTSSNLPLPVQLIVKNTPGSMHSLFALSNYLKDDNFCLATVDSVFNENEFSDFITYSQQNKNDVDGVLAITNFIDDEKPLCVAMNDTDIIKKFSDNKDGYNWATGGLYYFSPVIFNEMKEALDTGILRLRNFLRLLVNKGYILKGFSFSKIIDIDHVSDIRKAVVFLEGGE